jgi:hypothetical protein
MLGLPILRAMLLPDGLMFALARLLLRCGPRGLLRTLLLLPAPVVLRLAFWLDPGPRLWLLIGWPGRLGLPFGPAFLGTGPCLPAFGPGLGLGLPLGPGFLRTRSSFPAFRPGLLLGLPLRPGFLRTGLRLSAFGPGLLRRPGWSGFLLLLRALRFLLALIVLTVQRGHGFEQQGQDPYVDKPKRFHGVYLP